MALQTAHRTDPAVLMDAVGRQDPANEVERAMEQHLPVGRTLQAAVNQPAEGVHGAAGQHQENDQEEPIGSASWRAGVGRLK